MLDAYVHGYVYAYAYAIMSDWGQIGLVHSYLQSFAQSSPQKWQAHPELAPPNLRVIILCNIVVDMRQVTLVLDA